MFIRWFKLAAWVLIFTPQWVCQRLVFSPRAQQFGKLLVLVFLFIILNPDVVLAAEQAAPGQLPTGADIIIGIFKLAMMGTIVMAVLGSAGHGQVAKFIGFIIVILVVTQTTDLFIAMYEKVKIFLYS